MRPHHVARLRGQISRYILQLLPPKKKRPASRNLEGRRERRKERTRRALLDVALAHFARRGIYGTRIEDITHEADLGKGAFYNYFDSKDDLVATLFIEMVERLDHDYLSRVNPHSSLPERIAMLAQEHERFFETHTDYPILFHQARGLLMLDPAPKSRLRLAMKDYLRRVRDRLQKQTRDGQGPSISLDMAAALAGAMSGYRSYTAAAGMAGRSETVVTVVGGGVAALLSKKTGQESRSGTSGRSLRSVSAH